MRIVNTDGENLNIFWTTWGIYVKKLKNHSMTAFDFLFRKMENL